MHPDRMQHTAAAVLPACFASPLDIKNSPTSITSITSSVPAAPLAHLHDLIVLCDALLPLQRQRALHRRQLVQRHVAELLVRQVAVAQRLVHLRPQSGQLSVPASGASDSMRYETLLDANYALNAGADVSSILQLPHTEVVAVQEA